MNELLLPLNKPQQCNEKDKRQRPRAQDTKKGYQLQCTTAAAAAAAAATTALFPSTNHECYT